jgi:hypothetical protein
MTVAAARRRRGTELGLQIDSLVLNTARRCASHGGAPLAIEPRPGRCASHDGPPGDCAAPSPAACARDSIGPNPFSGSGARRASTVAHQRATANAKPPPFDIDEQNGRRSCRTSAGVPERPKTFADVEGGTCRARPAGWEARLVGSGPVGCSAVSPRQVGRCARPCNCCRSGWPIPRHREEPAVAGRGRGRPRQKRALIPRRAGSAGGTCTVESVAQPCPMG